MNRFLLQLTLVLGIILTGATFALSQNIQGVVKDADSGAPLAGANVVVKGTSQGTVTDEKGNFSLTVNSLPVTLQVSFLGYDDQDILVSKADYLTISLQFGLQLEDVLIVGSRFTPRTVITSPVPIDNVRIDDLLSTGQFTFDKMMHYQVPSFNSTQQTISDATAHFDPADLRGLGPSRTLILINGKRKNPSSLVYINDTPGKGEVGVDMKSIPASAIERVEVLRDGASAQYGSDAIAGVINIVLKDKVNTTDVSFYSGITTQGDGFTAGYDLNTGFQLARKGYVHLSTSFSDQNETNRAPSPGVDELFGVSSADNQWLRENPNMGMRVGQPNMTTGSIFYNANLPLNDKAELYSFGGLVYRRGISYALYRTPYWIPDPFFIFHKPNEPYNGFHPTFETDIFDHTLAFGVRGEKSGWKYDLSTIFGGNEVDYTVSNSLNRDLGAQSPTVFRPGGYGFRNQVSNLDLARQLGIFTLSLGTEFRTENFKAIPGDEASYFNETGRGGAQSFPGIQPQNAIDANRYNVGFYVDGTLDVTKDFLIGGAARFESYSDFGETFNWKAVARYKFLNDRFTVRASASTGFRAPSLHQIYLSIVQTLVSGGTVSNQGTFNNQSPIIRALAVPSLKEEQSRNLTAGIAFKPVSGMFVSLDYYRVAVDDRIVYSSSIASRDTTTQVYQILQDYKITSLKFFTNAVNTVTSGVDLVANYSTSVGAGELGVNLAANFNQTKIVGQIATPAPIAAARVDIFDRKEQSRILSARPQDKILIGLSYKIGKLRAVLNNTRFGAVTWQHDSDPNKDQTFSAKVVTDLYLDYRLTKKTGVSLAIHNLFDVYPDEIDPKGDVVTNLGGRFRYPWEVNQFGFNGATISAKLNVQF